MSKWSKETSGMEAIKTIASSFIEKNPEKKKRVWSDEYFAWGYYVSDVSDIDVLLLWCMAQPGDRVLLSSFGIGSETIVGTILGVQREADYDSAFRWKMKLLLSDKVTDVVVGERQLFSAVCHIMQLT